MSNQPTLTVKIPKSLRVRYRVALLKNGATANGEINGYIQKFLFDPSVQDRERAPIELSLKDEELATLTIRLGKESHFLYRDKLREKKKLMREDLIGHILEYIGNSDAEKPDKADEDIRSQEE
jgi:hypothetical protein